MNTWTELCNMKIGESVYITRPLDFDGFSLKIYQKCNILGFNTFHPDSNKLSDIAHDYVSLEVADGEYKGEKIHIEAIDVVENLLITQSEFDKIVFTPTLDKMMSVKDESEKLGDFLEWIQARYYMRGKKEAIDITDPTESFVPSSYSSYINVEELLAEYFNIDLVEAEREKQAILKGLAGVGYEHKRGG